MGFNLSSVSGFFFSLRLVFLPLVPIVANIQVVFVETIAFHRVCIPQRYTQRFWVCSQEKGVHMGIKETYFKWPIAKLI